MADDGLTIAVKGVDTVIAGFVKLDATAQAATLAATKKACQTASAAVKARMRGNPRWNHRGKSHVYSTSVTLKGQPKSRTRSGGVGKFTGKLYSGVGYRKPKIDATGRVVGAVGVGGSKIPENFFKRKWESKYPFFHPAIEASEPKIAAAYTAAYAKVFNSKF